jgi:hypothetical protein
MGGDDAKEDRTDDRIFTFEVLAEERRDSRRKPLETGRLDAFLATTERAKEMFVERYEDPAYARSHRSVKPGCVRFLDPAGKEVAYYTATLYHNDMKAQQQ